MQKWRSYLVGTERKSVSFALEQTQRSLLFRVIECYVYVKGGHRYSGNLFLSSKKYLWEVLHIRSRASIFLFDTQIRFLKIL